ncbi:MAG: peptidylprolyl isomerase, partial [Bacteroidota bacterium]
MVRAVVVLCSGVLLLAHAGCNRNAGKVVAEVGGEEITEQQFVERYEQYVESTGQRDNILLRQQILNNMINELLIYKDLARRGLDGDETYRAKMDGVLGQALLVAYARKIITDTSHIPEADLYKEFRAYNSKVTARYLYAKSEVGAKELRAKLEHGVTFEDLAKEVFEDPGLATNGGSLGTFGWGEMEPALEEAAFSIPVGAISEPLRASMGYAIVKVERRVENRFVTESDYVKVREKLYRAVVERKFSQLIKDELRRIEGDLAPSFDENIVGEVFKSWHLLIESPALLSEQVGNRT